MAARAPRGSSASQSRKSRQRIHGAARGHGSARRMDSDTDADLSAPIDELDKLIAAVERSGPSSPNPSSKAVKIAVGSRALDRTLVGVHQSALREACRPRLQFPDAPGDRAAVSRHAVRLQIVRGRGSARNFLTPDARWVQLRRGRPGDRQGSGTKAVEVPVVWNNVEGTKVSAFAGLSPSRSWRAFVGERSVADTPAGKPSATDGGLQPCPPRVALKRHAD